MSFLSGLLIKCHERTAEEEARSMWVARAQGFPVPRCLSYGCYNSWGSSHLGSNGWGSILMTRIDGYIASDIYPEAIAEQQARFKTQLRSLLDTMRSWSPPPELGGALGSVLGVPVVSYRIPPEISGPWKNKDAFIDGMSADIGTSRPDWADRGILVREFSTGSHRIVFTRRDLQQHNVLVDDCNLVAIIDWATAGWMPEWWEYAVALRLHRSWWAQMMKEIGGKKDEWELARDRHVLEYWMDGYRYF